MPFAKLFRNRWSALIWACGMLWFAFDVAGYAPQARLVPAKRASADQGGTSVPDTDATGTAVSSDDLNTLAQFGNQPGN